MAKYRYPKREIESIELRMAEGRTGHMGMVTIEASPFDGAAIAFEMADAAIKTWARDADPKMLGYRKLDFILKWVDGETYSGTFLLDRSHAKGSGHLAKHVKAHVKFMKTHGLVRPEVVRLGQKIVKSYQLS